MFTRKHCEVVGDVLAVVARERQITLSYRCEQKAVDWNKASVDTEDDRWIEMRVTMLENGKRPETNMIGATTLRLCRATRDGVMKMQAMKIDNKRVVDIACTDHKPTK
jgi:hypothetical protein